YATAMHDALIRHPWAGNLAVGLGGGGVARRSRLPQIDWLLPRLDAGRVCTLGVGVGGGGVPRPSRLTQIDWLLHRLREGGFSSELTYHGYHVLDAHILGFTLWELGHYAAAREMGPEFELEQFVSDLLDVLRAQGYADLAE